MMGSREPRSLKKTKLGVPDVYRQEPNQLEDILNETNVQKGFSNSSLVANESASALGDLPLSSLFGQLKNNFEEILGVKQKLNTLQDGGRRKPQKEHFWPVTPKTKEATAQWFHNLATGKFPPSLVKKIPIFHKKEEILDHLCEHSVPLLRAAWFLKMTATYYSSVSEAKISKKRQTGNAAQEWTMIITRYLKDLIGRLTEYFCSVPTASNSGSANTSSLFPQHQRPHIENAQKQWVYLTRLLCWMYEDNLLSAHMFLTWLVEQWKALKPDDDGLLKLLLPQTFQYLHDILRCQLLARNLARVCCWKLSYLLKPDEESGDEANGTAAGESETEESIARLRSSGMATKKNGSTNPQADYSNCSYHRNMVECLSCIVQSVALRCPTALLWMPSVNTELNTGLPSVGKGEEFTLKGFSPLDQLGYAPSELPFPSRLDQELREQITCHLQAIEDDICLRSAAAEGLWRSREYDNPHEATMIKFVLKLLEELDQYDYNKATRLGSVEELYERVFVLEYGSNDVGLAAIELIVPLLCDWAVNAHFGHVYRVYVVARLFHMAQARLQKMVSGSRDAGDAEGVDDARVPHLVIGQQEDCDDDDNASVASLDCVRFPFRDCLMHYLDTQAPLPGSDEGPSTIGSTFHRLVVLFGELIRTGVFSYSHYLSTLISRGDLQASPVQQDTIQCIIDEQKDGSFSLDSGTYGASELSSKPQKPEEPMEFPEIQMEIDSQRFKGGLHEEKFITGKSRKRLQSPDDLSDPSKDSKRLRRSESYTRIQMENLFGGDLSDSPPDSVKSADSRPSSPQSCTKRHFHYALKFPIPEEMCSEYFMKQRLVVLFGVGQDREEAAKELEQVTEEVCQHLTHTEDNTSTASVVYQTSLEDAVKSFVAASQFNRCRVLHACHEKLFPRHGDTSSQRDRYEGVSVDSVEFLFELMELAGDVVLLLDLVQELLIGEELYESSSDEAEETERLASGGAGETPGRRRHVGEMYVIGSKLVPSVLGVLWKYNRCVLLSKRTTQTVFEGLFRYVRHVSDSSVCSNAERCVLAYLNHLYTSCSHLQVTFRGVFEKLTSHVQSNICNSLKPAQTELKPNANQFSELSKDVRHIKERALYGELKKNDANLHSFVYRVMLTLTREDNRNSVQGLIDLCVHAVSQCKGLNAEFLGALRAMACPAEKKYGYSALLDAMNYRLPSVLELIALFTSVLVARECFSLMDVLAHVVQPSLKSARVHGEKSEQGVRLTCTLLQWLLTKPQRSSSVTAPSGGIFNPGQFVKSSTSSALVASDERRLLAAREMLDLPTVFSIIKILWRLSTPSGSSRVSSSLASNMTLTARTLTDLCRQPWMKTLFLKDIDTLCSKDMLMDMSLVAAEARYLLRLVCSPEGDSSVAHRVEETPEENVSRVVENLNLWTFNMSWLDLQLLIRQHRDDEQQSKSMLDCIAQCVMDIFWTEADCKTLSSNSNHNIVWQLIGVSVWLVSPLVSKLTPAVQGMLLRAAGKILQRDQWWKPNVERKIDTNK
jgi:mediator of RNA polymerase II transcription subunit 12